MNQLEQARAQIDTVDRQMAALFEQRMAAVRQVIEYKQATGMPILDSGREAQVIEKNTAYIAEEVLRPYYADLLRAGRGGPPGGRGGLQPHRPHPAVSPGQGPEPGHL